MVNSMTGFGCASGEFGGATYEVEIRSVNSRYYKSRIKLPDMLAFLEDDIDKLLHSSVSRGTINYTLRLKEVSAEMLFDINEKVLKTYMHKLAAIAGSSEMECNLDIAALLQLPGVMQMGNCEGEKSEKVKEFVLSLSGEAIEEFKQMRAAEGVTIEADLNKNCMQISSDAKEIGKLAEKNVTDYHAKLKKKVEALLEDFKIKLNEETLAREIAIYAERADICEELSRLVSHLNQFSQSCKLNKEAGRKLDFIAQEMLREANTIGSKVNDSEIANLVVNIKCCIDRIKEQVQNVE